MLRKKVREIEQKYEKTAGGDFNLQKIDSDGFNFESFAVSAQAVPLLATSRLIEVSNVFSVRDKTIHEGIKNILPKIPPTTVIIFIEEGVPDKRLGLFKALNVKKSAYEFKNLSGSALNDFVEQEVILLGGKITKEATALLVEYVGDDLWRLANEISKLTNYCDGEIATEDVEELVSKNITGNVFQLIEYISSGNKKNALSVLEKIIASDEPPLKVLAVIVYQFRVIAQIKSAVEQSDNNYQIAKICSLSPFQVMKNKSFAKKMTWDDISTSYGKLAFFDEGMKSGKIGGVEGLRELVINL